jgi:dTDP-4-amino-4,6-dideoxygalactose transaminase
MLTTSDPELARRFETLRLHGMSKDAWKRYAVGGSWRYDILESGFKYNMSDIQAALGLVQLRRLDGFIARRNVLVDRYRAALQDVACIQFQAPAPAGDLHAYHLAAIRLLRSRGAPERDSVIAALGAREIPFSVHFIPLHTMSHYQARYPGHVLPVTNALGEELLSLPLYPDLTDEQVDMVAESLQEILRDA